MTSLIEALSFGRLASCLAHAVGWSPVGKTLTLYGAEGPYSKFFNGIAGTVQSIDDDVLVVKRDGSDEAPGATTSLLRLTPRHKGWSPFSLMMGRIAVVVEAPDLNGRAGPVAIAIAAIDRSRGPVR